MLKRKHQARRQPKPAGKSHLRSPRRRKTDPPGPVARGPGMSLSSHTGALPKKLLEALSAPLTRHPFCFSAPFSPSPARAAVGQSASGSLTVIILPQAGLGLENPANQTNPVTAPASLLLVA